MSEPVPSPHTGLRLTLNSDGKSHRAINIATILVLLIGLASFILSIVIRNDTAASGIALAVLTTATGLASMVGGLVTQMVSATTEQRILIVTGIIAGFVGFAVGLAHGGFSG